jgi:proteic killer suppression protein
VIKSIRHKGLERFFETGSASGIKADQRKKLRMQLTALDTATTIEDMDIPGFRLHPLKGKRSGVWAVDVSGNWRLTFRFEDGQVHDLDYEDYH